MCVPFFSLPDEGHVDNTDCSNPAEQASDDSPQEKTMVVETSVGSRPSRSTIDIPAITQRSDKKEVELQNTDLSTEQVSENVQNNFL